MMCPCGYMNVIAHVWMSEDNSVAPVGSLFSLCGSRKETQAARTTRQALSQGESFLSLFDVSLFVCLICFSKTMVSLVAQASFKLSL